MQKKNSYLFFKKGKAKKLEYLVYVTIFLLKFRQCGGAPFY